MRVRVKIVEMRQLGRGLRCPTARRQVNGDASGVVGEIVDVEAAAVMTKRLPPDAPAPHR